MLPGKTNLFCSVKPFFSQMKCLGCFTFLFRQWQNSPCRTGVMLTQLLGDDLETPGAFPITSGTCSRFAVVQQGKIHEVLPSGRVGSECKESFTKGFFRAWSSLGQWEVSLPVAGVGHLWGPSELLEGAQQTLNRAAGAGPLSPGGAAPGFSVCFCQHPRGFYFLELLSLVPLAESSSRRLS